MTLKKIGAGKLPQPQNSESFVSRATVVLGLSERACVHLRGVVARYKAKAAAGFALASATASSTDLTREQLEEHKVGINEHTAAALLYAEHDAQWHKENPEYAARHYQEHRDEKLEYGARYYQEHRDQLLENGAKWREANPEYGAKWREANPEYGAQWREANPEYWREANQERREARELRIATASPILLTPDLPDPPENISGYFQGTASPPRLMQLMSLVENDASLEPHRCTIRRVVADLTASGSYTAAEKEAAVEHNITLLHQQVGMGLLQLRSSRPADGGEGVQTKIWTEPGASMEGYAPLVPAGASMPEVGDPSTSAHFASRPVGLGRVRKHMQGGGQSISIGGSGGSQLLFRETKLPSGDRQAMSSLVFMLEEAGRWVGHTPIGEGAESISVAEQVMCHLIDGKGHVYLHAPTVDELTAAGLLTGDGELRLSACKRVKTGDTDMDESLPAQQRGITLTGRVNKLALIGSSMPITGPLYTQPEVEPEADTVRFNTHPTSFRRAPVVVTPTSAA